MGWPSALAMAGWYIEPTDWLPTEPTDAERARRIVRHGLADVLAWLGEDVGPEPDDMEHVLVFKGARTMLVSRDLYADLYGQALTPAIERIANGGTT